MTCIFFSLFRYHLLLEENMDWTRIPLTKGCFVSGLVEIGQLVLGVMKMWNVYRRTDRQTKTTDNRWPKKQKSLRCTYFYFSPVYLLKFRFFDWNDWFRSWSSGWKVDINDSSILGRRKSKFVQMKGPT